MNKLSFPEVLYKLYVISFIVITVDIVVVTVVVVVVVELDDQITK